MAADLESRLSPVSLPRAISASAKNDPARSALTIGGQHEGASFERSLLAAQESLREASIDRPGGDTSGGASALPSNQPPASTLSNNGAASHDLGCALVTTYPGGLRPTATIGHSNVSLKPTMGLTGGQTGVTSPLVASAYQSMQSSGYITAFDRLRQRNDLIRQRLVGATGQTQYVGWLNTPGVNSLTQVQATRTVSSPSAVMETRPLQPVDGATGKAMKLTEYPRPPQDNGRGMHWIPTLYSDPATVDRFVKELVDMNIKWTVFLNRDCNIGDNDYLVKQLVANGIEPVMRVYTPDGRPIEGDLKALVNHYKPLGVNYYQLYNEPNLCAENQGQSPDVNRYLDFWIPAAQAVTEAGGLPGLGSLAPGGNFDDIEFLKLMLDGIKARGKTDVLDRAWLGIHNYTLNHPLDYTKDSNGFLKFRWYDDIVRDKLGRSLPIIGTEGGTHVGVDCDQTMPAVSEARQVEMVVGAYDYMKNAEPYFFANTYWIIANQVGGGHDEGFEWQALFRKDGTSPLVAALKAMDPAPRALPVTPEMSSPQATNVTDKAINAIDETISDSVDFGLTVVNEALKYLGRPYVWGGESPSGFDCTGFTWYVMRQLGQDFPLHDLHAQLSSGPRVARADLRPGDLVFFQNTYQPGLSHVGIYVGDNRFVHAASERLGVVVSDLDDSYWGARYVGACRPLG